MRKLLKFTALAACALSVLAALFSGVIYFGFCAPYEFNSQGRYFDAERSVVHTDSACVFGPLAIVALLAAALLYLASRRLRRAAPAPGAG